MERERSAGRVRRAVRLAIDDRVGKRGAAERVGLHVERMAVLVGRRDRDRGARHRDLQEVEDAARRGRRGCSAACGALELGRRPADAVRIVRVARPDRLQQTAASTRDVGDRHTGRAGIVPLVEVRMSVECDLDAVLPEESLQLRGSFERCIRRLARVVRVERVVGERELQSGRVRLQVVEQPLVFGCPGSEVRGRVVGVHVRISGVRVTPGRIEHVEAGGAGVECVPLARVVRGARAVDAAVRVVLIPAGRRGNGIVLRPRGDVGVARPAEAMISRAGEERDRAAGDAPEAGPEYRARVRALLLEIAVVDLAAVRVAVVADRDREPGATGRNLGEQIRHVGTVAIGVDLAPVAEHVERERGGVAGSYLRAELRGAVGTEEISASEQRAVAVRSLARKSERRLPLVLRHRPDSYRDTGSRLRCRQ